MCVPSYQEKKHLRDCIPSSIAKCHNVMCFVPVTENDDCHITELCIKLCAIRT